MKIAVIGAGIIGIATAYELAQDGHQVTVYDTKSAAAEGASFANASVVAPSHCLPLMLPNWTQPSTWNFLRSVRNMTLKTRISPRDMRWLWSWSRSTGEATDSATLTAAFALGRFSEERLLAIENHAALEFEGSQGHLVIFPTEASALQFQSTLAILKTQGVSFNALSASELANVEPALTSSPSLYGGVHFANDRVANCRQFALLLKLKAQRRGVEFAFNTTIEDIQTDSRITLISKGQNSPHSFDSVVLCTGDIPTFMRQRINTKIPTASVYGYSLSATIREPVNAPRSVVTDVASQIVLARIGNRVRVCGGAELGADPQQKDPTAVEQLYKALHDYFPGAVQHPIGTQVWKGVRTMTSDGLPMIGASDLPRVWLNLAHGAGGWSTACGSARLLADLVGNKAPAIDATAFSPARVHTRSR